MSARPELRPYQLTALAAIDAALRAGKSPLLVLPTGAGKTVVAAEAMHREREAGGRALFLAPRRELVTQASRALVRIDLPHGILMAGTRRAGNLYASAHVASLDTVRSRAVRRGTLSLPSPTLVIVDEAHLAITKKRSEILSLWPDAKLIGLTATPTRKDGRALGALFDELIQPVTTAELAEQGYLVRAKYFSLAKPDLERVRTRAGDFHEGDLSAAMNRPKLVGDIVETWLERAHLRRTVVFAVSVDHSRALRVEFLNAGVCAEHVDATTPQAERDAVFARFTSGKTQVLVNCQLATYGFDLPELSCVVLARPTQSLMLYLQMIGRGLRIADGKANCLILDHAGNVHRHGFATDSRLWTLEGDRALVSNASQHKRAAVAEAKVRDCPECAAVFAESRACPSCGYCFEPAGKRVHTLDGELVEVGSHLAPEEQDRLVFYGELKGYAEERGYQSGWAWHKFRERYQLPPPRDWESASILRPTVQTRRWILSRTIAWRKSQTSRAVQHDAR